MCGTTLCNAAELPAWRAIDKVMGHILGYLLPLEMMGTNSPCAEAFPFSCQRQIAKTMQFVSTFNLTVDLCGRSLVSTFLSCMDAMD